MIKGKAPDDEPIPTPLTDIQSESINRISIQHEDKPSIRIEKTNSDWQMIKPYQAPAHPNRIESILGLLSIETSNQLDIADVDLAQLELETPGVTLQLNDHVFAFGSTNPLDQSRYILFNNKIYTITDQLYYQLTTNESFFINPKLLLTPDAITFIETSDYLLKNINGDWQLEFKTEQVESTPNIILNGWQQAEANQVKQIEEETSIATVTIGFEDNSKKVFDIVATEPELILADKPSRLQYHFSKFVSDIIFPKPAAAE